MAGLKTFLGRLSPLLGVVTPAALYERQRVLVDIGLIKPRAGRGPGSGVAFTAENLAALVISILATDSLSEIDQRVVDLCNAQPEPTLILGIEVANFEIGRAEEIDSAFDALKGRADAL